MPKRPYQVRRGFPKKFNGGGRIAPVKIGNLFKPSTSEGPVITIPPENKTKAPVKSVPSLLDCNIITPKRLKTIAIAIINDTQPALMEEQSIEEPQSRSAKKKKLKQKQRKSIEKPASSSVLEYPDNNLLKRKIHISCDPLDDIFERFNKPRTAHPVIDLEGIEEHTTEMVETPRKGRPSLNATTTSDFTLVDADSTVGTSQLLIDSTSSDEEEIVCLGEKSSIIQKTTNTNDVEVMEKIKVIVEKRGEIVIDEEGDDDVVLLEDTSMDVTNIRMELLMAEPDEPGITAEALKYAAMEDSLVKGTCQEYATVIRHWELIKKLIHKPGVKDTVIRVCTYNILCQETVKKTGYLYRHLLNTPNEYVLYWDYRWPLLKQNLEHIHADIFGLQEVQDTHFQQYICPLMTSLGYGSMWTPKTKTENANSRDGCALFYRRDKFEYIFSKQVEYYCGEDMCLDRPQIGQILRVKEKTTQKELVIANTHILFNMKRGDVKLGQLSMLLANLRAEMDDHGEAPLIIMGDFNMDRGSYLYKFLTEGTLFLRGLPRSCLASEKEKSKAAVVNLDDILPPKVQIGRDCKFFDKKKMKPGQFPIFSVQKSKVPAHTITHPFNLWTAHAPLIGRKSEDEMSTYHIDSGNPDFIFYTIKEKQVEPHKRTIFETPDLRLYRRVTLPTIQQCRETLGPWPNKHVPSDHIPLIVEFQLRGDPVQ